MLIYEKNNKLNINFDNSTEAEPDVVISKEDGQVNIEAGGQPIGGGGSEPLVVTFSGTTDDGNAECDKTRGEIVSAFTSGKIVSVIYEIREDSPAGVTRIFPDNVYVSGNGQIMASCTFTFAGAERGKKLEINLMSDGDLTITFSNVS